jgi:5-formyltetrahydrofolate cyclo-ligase
MRALVRQAPADPAALAAIRSAVESWLETHPECHRIATFHPLADEPDLTPLPLRHTGRVWLYPRINGEALSFHPVSQPARDLVPGAYGILEPAARLPAIPLTDIDVFLCPGLAFDTQGGRLGRGMGFYDRTLAKARSAARKAGICWPYQRVPDTFNEPHDIRMDIVFCGLP